MTSHGSEEVIYLNMIVDKADAMIGFLNQPIVSIS